MRFEQIADVRVRAVNGVCEELSLSVQGEDDVCIELPVDGPPDYVVETAHSIATITNAKVLFITS